MEKATYQFIRLFWFLVSVLEVLLVFRFLMKLVGANPAASFTQLVYNASAPFVAPFQFVFPTEVVQGNVFEWTTLLAALVYWFLAWAIVHLLLLTRPVSKEQARANLDAEAM